MKRYGQNFLYDVSILKRIIQVSQLGPDDYVVEIGTGHGLLTRLLAERVRRVTTIELDKRLYEKAKKELEDFDNIELVYGDALKYPFEKLSNFKVVANIPYYITSPLIFKLLEAREKIDTITITVQKEVAERVVAKPGSKSYGILSIMVQYYAKPFIKFIIPRGAFRPPPNVDSAVLHIIILRTPSVDVKDEGLFFKIVKAAFSKRRKMLSNSLKVFYKDVKKWLEMANVEPTRRPETLTIKEFAKIADSLCLLL
jgi:16S rRNA (adenine1518-N6/adenine1519-N6)-dimethyltransferase